MGDKGQEGGESQVEIWKIKRVRLKLELCSCPGRVTFSEVAELALLAAAYQSLGGG